MTWTYTDFHDVFDSGSIDGMWYNRLTNELVVEYLSGSTAYGWRDVPVSIWDELVRQATIPAGSVGSFHANNVKGLYPSFSPSEFEFFSRFQDKFQKVALPVEPAAPLHNFVVKGLRPFTEDVRAISMDEAIAAVKGDSDVTITSVTVNFDA